MRALEMLIAVLTLAIVTTDTFHIDSELTYTTTTACDKITKHLPKQYELAGLLLPNDTFDGEISLTKNILDHTTCMLHLRSEGDVVSSVKNVFEVAREMNTKLTELVETQYLRSLEGRLQELKLTNISFKLNHHMYAMNLEPDIVTQESLERGEVTMDNGEACTKLSSEDVLHVIVPIEMVKEMKIKRLVHDKELTDTKCVVGLNIITRVPSFASNGEAFEFLETIDHHVEDYFGLDGERGERDVLLSNATMQFFTKTSSQSASVLGTHLTSQSLNPPTKEIMIGIMMGVVLLGMMLMGMTYQKKRHEQHCQERHHKASRIAQIQRISYRMGYGRVPVEKEEDENIL